MSSMKKETNVFYGVVFQNNGVKKRWDIGMVSRIIGLGEN
jgi:hypothetical protein